MKEIYRDASQVLIWLGLHDSDSDLAFDLLESIYTVDNGVTDSVRKRQGRGIIASKDLLPSERTRVISNTEFVLDDLQSHHLSALRMTFSQRSWWKRIWIIQEAVYARDVTIICGKRSIPWELLERLIKSDNFRSANSLTAQLASNMETAIIIATLRNTLATVIQETIYNGGSWSKYSHCVLKVIIGRYYTDDSPKTLLPNLEKPFKTTLDSLMVVFETSACTDPRDQISGLLGLADNPMSEILLDYTKSPYTIFEEATRSIIGQNLSLDLLAYVHRSAQSNTSTKEPGQSSWVPDFAAAREYSTLISSSAPRSLYNSSRGYEFDRELLNISSSFLRIWTIECDLIGSTAQSTYLIQIGRPGSENGNHPNSHPL
jgi:hypothetical protein